jgi:hypothetical protein
MSLLGEILVKINNSYKTSVHKYEGKLGKPAGKTRFRLNVYIHLNVDKDYDVQVWTDWIHLRDGEDQGEIF